MRCMTLARFSELWRRNLLPGVADRSGAVFDALERRYGESHRHYHNAGHIDLCLDLFDDVRGQLNDDDAVELAIWFHDVVYDGRLTDNEARSADWFAEQSEGQFSAALRGRVRELILSTTHDHHPVGTDEKVLLDIDLASFGLDWAQFAEDGVNIRREQPHLSDEAFFGKQMAFQESLLRRQRFYLTDYFFRRFETKARENLRRHLDELNARGFFAVSVE
ncbi:hypothetical protein Q4485_16865 [Granulosicoccaceae sp. 1_MG-2023]|nr:hypothetical protein [Granulosicoccaceae sp. 1_MG-2023]